MEGWKLKQKKKVDQRLIGIKQCFKGVWVAWRNSFYIFFPRQFNSSVRSDGREGDNEIYLIVVDFIFHMNAFFFIQSSHLSTLKKLVSDFTCFILCQWSLRLVVCRLELCKIHDGDINPKTHWAFLIWMLFIWCFKNKYLKIKA